MNPRLYKGRCPHGAWWVLLDPPESDADELTATCPTCGVIHLTAEDTQT